jgi:hypothetical protein
MHESSVLSPNKEKSIFVAVGVFFVSGLVVSKLSNSFKIPTNLLVKQSSGS